MTLTLEDRQRLAGQELRIAEMLAAGPATNDELSRVARKYTSRLSGLRALGYRIRCERLQGGLTRYHLEGYVPPASAGQGRLF